jgi:hypothetical protein
VGDLDAALNLIVVDARQLNGQVDRYTPHDDELRRTIESRNSTAP